MFFISITRYNAKAAHSHFITQLPGSLPSQQQPVN
jgi:hypothetical protein